MKKLVHLILCLAILAFFYSNYGCRERTHGMKTVSNPTSSDTLEIFECALNYSEFKAFTDTLAPDTIFVVLNESLQKKASLETNGKVIKYLKKPAGYPKVNFDYKKFQISLENLKISEDAAECMVLIKNLGVLGEFSLIKNHKKWSVSRYSKNMI